MIFSDFICIFAKSCYYMIVVSQHKDKWNFWQSKTLGNKVNQNPMELKIGIQLNSIILGIHTVETENL